MSPRLRPTYPRRWGKVWDGPHPAAAAATAPTGAPTKWVGYPLMRRGWIDINPIPIREVPRFAKPEKET